MAFLKPSRTLIVIAFLLFSVQSALAKTYFEDKPGSCKIFGDTDVYGIGIRLGYYLQWVAVLFATWIAPEQAKTARTAANIITVAVFANTFRGAQEGSLVAAEWWIVLWLTFVLSLLNIPDDWKRSSSSFGVMLILWCMITAAQPWLYFKGLDTGHKHGCVVKVFFFTGINVYNHVWRTFWKVGSVVECLLGVTFFFTGIVVIIVGLFSVDESSEPESGAAKIASKLFLTFGQLVTGIITIVQVEMTIRVNSIDLSSVDLMSSGQLIPFLIGCLTIAAVFGHGLKKLVQKLRRGDSPMGSGGA
ncbi:hypothetical protein FGG08_002118 [Glutinoglossum americanum]|uniref:Uncharacterized protein n=1 Tax=Glutinoglossum americanum TaxID=1670608 RepID=A0A9P8IA83_9PEZI|nr:hypothetical protein FGG08_002118 [Glutinoglossum americanum]